MTLEHSQQLAELHHLVEEIDVLLERPASGA
jgi:hypothetical protein